MAIFNKKNALVGWAVLEALRIMQQRRAAEAGGTELEERPRGRKTRKALTAATGAALAAGTVAALRRRRSGPGAGM